MDPNQQTVQPSVQNSNEPQTSGSSKNFWKHIGIGMAIVSCLTAIGIIGFVLSSKNSNKTTPKVSKFQTTLTVEPSPTPDSTAKWGLYKSDRYSYVIKYPSDLFTECGSTDAFLLYKGKDLIKGDTCAVGESTADFSFSVVTSLNPPQSFDTNCYSFKQDQIKVSGIVAARYSPIISPGASLKTCNIGPGTFAHSYFIQFNYSGLYFQFEYSDSDLLLKEQLLSTFKFIDQNSSPSPK